MRKSLVAAYASIAAAVVLAGGGSALAQPSQKPPAPRWKATPLNLHQGSGNMGDVARSRMRSGDCQGALDAFDSALETSIDSTLYRDRGICHEKLGHPYPAIADYQAYLTSNNEAPDADDIRLRLQRLLDQVNGRQPGADDDNNPPSAGGSSGAAAGGSGASGSGSASVSAGGSSGGGGGDANVKASASTTARPKLEGTESELGDSVELGVRLGYAIPFGDAVGGPGNNALSNLYSGAIPIWVDIGYRMPDAHLYIGLFAQYAFAIINNNNGSIGQSCNASGVSCSGGIAMVGADVHYHFSPGKTLDPWAGLGLGWEFANVNASVNGASAGFGVNGFQFVNGQFGVDYRVLPTLGVGPFLMMSVGQYENCSNSGQGSLGCTIPDKAVHGWFTIGFRAAYDIGT
jgi:hypothetical protein